MAKTIAAYGGGFKPPTQGHLDVVKRALETNPDIDEFIIYVGGGERDGITQAEAVLIWEVYQSYLPMKVKIEPSKAPIGDIIRLGKNNPQDTVYFVIGGREGREDDMKDIESRTKGIEEKYPNMQIKIQQTPDGGMSGTNARKAAKVSPEEFYKYLPSELTDEEKEEVYNIVKPMVNEALIPSASEIKAKFKDLVANVKQQGGDAKKALTMLVKAAKGEIDLSSDDKAFIKLQLKDALKAVLGTAIFALPAGSLVLILLKAIKLHGLVIPSAFLNERLEPYEFKVLFTENEDNTTRYTFTTNQNTKYLVDLVRHPETEVKILYGAIKEGKKSWIQPTNEGEPLKIISTVTEIIKEYYSNTPGIGVVKWKATKGKNDTRANSQRDKLSIKFFQREVPGVKVVHEGQETRIILPQLNENASYSSDIDYKAHIRELTKYMIRDGWNIQPLPKVVFKHGNSENARDFFGKTAYYDPNTKTIVLYTEGRHPKDIVRSFSHEMVHHEQNLEGRLGNIQTTNTQEDDRLNDIEKEANLNGTMTFRNWTDSLNEIGDASAGAFPYNQSRIDTIVDTLKDKIENQPDAKWQQHLLPLLRFSSPNADYEVITTAQVDKPLNIPDFQTRPNLIDLRVDFMVGESDEATNIGEQYKVMATMTQIIKSLMDKVSKIEGSKLHSVKIFPKSDDGSEEADVDSKRGKLYQAYVKKNLPSGWDMSTGKDARGGSIVLYPPLEEGFDKKLGKDPFGLNAFAYELVQGLEKELDEGRKKKKDPKKGTGKKPKGSGRRLYTDEDPKDTVGVSFRTKEDIVDTLNKKSFKAKSHARQSQVINLIHQRVRAAYGRAKDPETKARLKRGLDYIEKRKEASKKKTKRLQAQKESLNEGRYDSISRQLASIALNAWKSDFKDGASYGYFMGEITPEEYPTDLTFTFKALGRFVDGGYKHNGYSRADGEVGVKYEIPKDAIPQIWEEVYMDLISTIRHEIEHQTQGGKNVKKGKEMESDQELRKLIRKGGNDIVKYVTLPSEIESNVHGLYLKAKKWRRPYDEVVDEYIKDFLKITNPADVSYVKNKWQEVAKKRSLPNLLNEGVYDSIISKLAKNVLNSWKTQFNDNPKRLFALLDTSYEFEDAKGRPMDFEFLAKLDFKKTKDRQYKVDGGANEGDDETEGFVALNFQVDPRELPQMWSTIAMDIRDVLRHELEHLTQGGWNVRMGKEMEDDSFIRDLIQKYKTLAPKNYFLLDKEVDAMLQGMYFKAKKSRTPFADVIDDYLDKVGLEPEEKEEIKTRWRSRTKALSLPLFEELEEMEYEIYSDMDGVLTDFDAQFMAASDGIRPSEYERNMGKEGFWELVDGRGVGFWVGMPWMPDGKKYWDYIKEYNPILLSSPSRSETSRLGKRLWVRNNLPGTKLILAQAKDKQNYARKNRILIDDRPSNIEEWRSQGGVGILHTSASNTIRQLKELGL